MGDGVISGLIVLGSFLGYLALFVINSFLLSAMSGWRELARHYAIDESELAPEPQMKWQSLSMGFSSFASIVYFRIVSISIDEDYIYLSIFRLFGLGHKLLRIPFKDIKADDTKFLFFNIKRFVIAKAHYTNIYMRPQLAQKIEALAVAAK